MFKELIIVNVYQPFKGQGALECFVARADDSLLDVDGNIGLACWSFRHHKPHVHEPQPSEAASSAVSKAVLLVIGESCRANL